MQGIKGMNFASVEYGDTVEYLMDDRYAFEQKMDGTRALIKVSPDEVQVFSRAGTPLKHTAALQHLPGIVASLPARRGRTMVVDGEIMFDSGLFHAFDLPYLDEGASRVRPELIFMKRRLALEALLEGSTGPFVKVVRSAVTPRAKHELLRRVEEGNGEGVIIKRRDAPYEPGKRVSHSFKAKLIRTADVVVMKVDRPDPKHGSITFGIYNDEGQLTELSNCSAIGKPHVDVGDVIEVAYLAWTPGGGLREPRMMRVREDKAPADCREDQLVPYSKAII